MFSRGIVLIHDNARLHTANVTCNNFLWILAGKSLTIPPPYRPNLTLSDFHIFSHMKSFLGAQNFNEDDGIQKKPVPRYDMCLNNDGNYVEK